VLHCNQAVLKNKLPKSAGPFVEAGWGATSMAKTLQCALAPRPHCLKVTCDSVARLLIRLGLRRRPQSALPERHRV
jgi:hypothetical protein